MAEWVSWGGAMQHALVGPGGFYRAEAVPGSHFRTSVTAAPDLIARAITVLLDELRGSVGGGDGPVDVVDLGAGGGALLAELATRAPEHVRLVGVDVAPRPAGLPARVAWSDRLPDRVEGLLIAHEYLDNMPVDVVEVDPDGIVRQVLVDPATGDERLGEPPTADDAAWLARWWPIDGSPPGCRAEIGRLRDAAWATAVATVRRGLAVAVDYDHLLADRPPLGTLTGYRRGRTVQPVPDGSCDLTAHVALDACAAAGTDAGATSTLLIRQTDALRALGTDARRPPVEAASRDPIGYLRSLSAAGSAAELLDRSGLGGFGWLVQGIGIGLSERLVQRS